MAFANDTTLAARPDLFQLVESPRRSRFFRRMAFTAPLVPLGFAIVMLVAGDEIFMPIFFFVMSVGAVFAFLHLAKSSREWRLRDGRPLHEERVYLDIEADEARSRLETRDPAVYTPMKIRSSSSDNEHAPYWISAFWPEDGERVSYVVVAERGRPTETPAIIEMRGQVHDEFVAALQAGLDKPYAGQQRW